MLGIYIHIPFCLSKCPYCDFYSLPYREELAQQYVQAAVRAVETSPTAGQAVDSVYFGGGTPGCCWERDFWRFCPRCGGTLRCSRKARSRWRQTPPP